MSTTPHRRENRRGTIGYFEAVEDDTDGEVVLRIRLDKAGINPFENEIQIDGRLFIPSEVEEDLLDALDPRGGRHE
jgi:hypothetical protein